MDFKPVICPYCGREMELDDRSFEGHGFWYSCDCGASSPFCKSEEEAYQYANPIVRQKWISVEEGLPNEGQKVMVCGLHNGMQVGAFRGLPIHTRNGSWWWKKNTILHATHWMPLPEPPEEEA